MCCCSSVVERVIGNDEVGSSILPNSTIFLPDGRYRGVAQLVERRSPKPKVAGSSPAAPARYKGR